MSGDRWIDRHLTRQHIQKPKIPVIRVHIPQTNVEATSTQLVTPSGSFNLPVGRVCRITSLESEIGGRVVCIAQLQWMLLTAWIPSIRLI